MSLSSLYDIDIAAYFQVNYNSDFDIRSIPFPGVYVYPLVSASFPVSFHFHLFDFELLLSFHYFRYISDFVPDGCA